MVQVSLKDLLASEFFGKSEVLAGEAGLSNRVSSATILDSPDAPKYLKGGEVVVTTAYSLLNNVAQQTEVVENLARAKAAGLGIKLRFFNHHLPEAMREKACEIGFPIFTIPDESAYTSILDFIMNHIMCQQTKTFKPIEAVREEFLNNVGDLGLAGIARTLSKWTGRKAAVVFRNETYEAPEAFLPEHFLTGPWKWKTSATEDLDGDLKAQVMRYSLRQGDGPGEWIGAELKAKGKSRGHVWLWEDNEPFDKNDFTLLAFAVKACLMEIERIVSLQEERQKYESQFLVQLLDHQFATWEEAANRAKDLGWELPETAVVCLVKANASVDLDDNGVYSCLNRFLRLKLGQNVVNAIYKKNTLVVLIPETIEDKRRLANELSSELLKVVNGNDFCIGIGRTASFADLGTSFREAGHASEFGPRLNEATNVFPFEKLGFFRLLAASEPSPEAARYYEDYLKPLIDHDRINRSSLAATLCLFLHHGCNFRATAKALGLHPNSVRYRVQTIERICRADLQSQEDRFNLAVALKLSLLFGGSPELNKLQQKLLQPKTV
jgi:purine catabolism regulator